MPISRTVSSIGGCGYESISRSAAGLNTPDLAASHVMTPRNCPIARGLGAIAALSLALMLSGCAPAIAPGHVLPENRYARQFEEYWYRFDRLYPYFDYKHVDWQAAYTRYRPLADQVRNERQLVTLLDRMVKPLRDVHVWFRAPDGKYLSSYDPPRSANPNWNARVITERVHHLGHYRGADWGFGRVDGFRYVFIADWDKRRMALHELERVLTRFEPRRGLILDVRVNAGGNTRLAYRVAGHFAAIPHLTEYFRYRNGPLPGDLSAPRPKYLEPSLGYHYTGPVMLLVGPDSFSSTENFITAMQTLPNVTTVGATTGGASGCPRRFTLGDGWHYSVPICYDMTADHRVIEWNGIPPEVPVPTTAADFQHGDDPVLDAAIALLEAGRSPRRLSPRRPERDPPGGGPIPRHR